jgi:hypothetical protein
MTEITNRPTIRERAEAGAALLSTAQLSLINLDLLDMSNPERCALGQPFGDYGRGVNALFDDEGGSVEDMWAADHGFLSNMDAYEAMPADDEDYVAWDEFDRQRRAEYRELTTTWREVIRERLDADSAQGTRVPDAD